MTEQKKIVTTLRFLYPLWALLGIYSLMYVQGRLIVPDDPASTAQNIADQILLSHDESIRGFF
jgi:hypothetical protein